MHEQQGHRGRHAPIAIRSADAGVLIDLAHRFGKDIPLARATQIDAGFNANVLAGMIATLDRFTDNEIPLPDDSSIAELRAFYATWRSELEA